MQRNSIFIFLSFCRYSAAFIFLYTGFYSCKKDKPAETTDFGYNYFPNEIGHYVIYDVDSIHHNDFTGKVDTFKFQVKELIDTVFPDNENRPTVRIERYRKDYDPAIPYDQLTWTLKDVWVANRTNVRAEKVEENIRFVKLVFPVYENRKWNGNAFNTLGTWEYEYMNIDTKKIIAKFSFDSTLFVKQLDKENLIEKQYYTEIYAKHVGLVYKQIVDVYSANVNPAIPLMQRITKGIEYAMVVNSYGKE